MADPDDDASTDDDKLLVEAKQNFALCEDWESYFRDLYVEDQKFGHADPDNQYQWPNQLLTDRLLQQRPTLTVNKVRIHCLQIINDAKQNKAGIKVSPTSNEATYEAAEVYEDVIRHIEYRSRAPQAYDKAMENAVFGGYGACRIVSDYLAPDSFDQELLIRGIPDPLTVYIDPNAKEADKSDMDFAFVFDDMSREKFNRLYPEFKDDISSSQIGADYSTNSGWVTTDTIRVAEYWRRKHDRKTLVSVIHPETGERVSKFKEDVQPSVLKALRANPNADYRERETDAVKVECVKIAGDHILERQDWPGQYIPIVPMVGEETIIDGQLDRKGHVRYLKDPQRIYNIETSAEVEFGALQTKTPYVAAAESIEGYEEFYRLANVQNLAYLPYKAIGDNGEVLPPPRREPPPRASEAYLRNMQNAEQEMMMASGQYQAQMGENENAKSGKAIAERQRQGDNATYHFIDNQAIMIRQIARVLIDVIPSFYDTKRLLRIRGEDGMLKNILIDPNAEEAVQKQADAAAREVNVIFNPNVGMYSVEADIGPNYATKRQEAWNAIVQILAQDKQLAPIIGDLLFINGDFPGADEIAKRLRRMVPPQALNDGPPMADQQMQQQIQQLTQMLQELGEQLKNKDAETNIKAFDAETKRLQAIGNAGPIVTADQAQPLIAENIGQMLQGGMPETFGAPAAPQQAAAATPPQPQLPQG